jgi:hypothetical protein
MFKSKLSFSEKVAKISELRTEELKLMDEIMEEMKLAQKVLGFMDAESSGTKTHKRRKGQIKLNEPKECEHGCGKIFSDTTIEYAIHVKLEHMNGWNGKGRKKYKSKYSFRVLKNGRARCNTCMTVIKRESVSQHYIHVHPEIAADIYKPRETQQELLQGFGSNK